MAVALLGRQTPRLELRPDCWSCAADEAIEFYESIGPRLDPWQKLSLEVGLGEDQVGDWVAPEVGLICQRQNGKGDIAQALELTHLFVWGTGVIVHTAHLIDTSKTAFRRTVEIVEGSDDLMRRVRRVNRTNGEEAIELLAGGVLKFRTRTGRGGRGITGDVIVFDEALELTMDQMEALVPIILARNNPQIWYTSTVPKFADQYLTALRARAMAGAAGLAYVEWGVDKGVDINDPVVHAEANPAYGIRVTEKTLAIARGALGDEGFMRECLGIWPDMAAGAVLDIAEWRRMTDPASRRADGAELALAVDITPLRDHASIGMYALRADGREHMQLVDYREDTEWVPARLAELKAALDPICIVYDRKNGAHTMLDDFRALGMERPIDREEYEQEPRRGDLLELETQEAVDAVGQFIDGFRAPPLEVGGRRVPRYAHLGQPPLDLAVANAQARLIGDAGQIAWGRKASEVDIGPVQVVTNARYGYHLWIDVVTNEPVPSVWRI